MYISHIRIMGMVHLLLLEGLGLLYYIGEIIYSLTFFFISLVVNVKKKNLIYLLFDLKKSC